MAMSKEDFIKEVESMTVMELNELVKALEEKFSVSAAAHDGGRSGTGSRSGSSGRKNII